VRANLLSERVREKQRQQRAAVCRRNAEHFTGDLHHLYSTLNQRSAREERRAMLKLLFTHFFFCF
jgi:hypothetical protein